MFPTDAKLLNRARERLVRLAKKLGVRLRQSYRRVGKLALIKHQRYAHAHQFKRNRYEVPRGPQSARAGVAGGHPVLAHGLDDGWNIAVGVAQKFPSLAAPPRWSEQRTPLVVTTVQQDGQEQRVVDVAGIEQRRPIPHPEPHGGVESSAPRTRIDLAIGLAPMHWLEPIRGGRQNATDVVVAPRDGADRRELRGAAVIEGIGIDGEQRTDPVEWVNRHRPGHDRSDVAIQHRDAGGDRMPVGAVLQPSLELRERLSGCRHRR